MMKAITVDFNSATKALSLAEIPEPHIQPDEVLIDVQASGVNRADLVQRRGHYPPPPGASEILGLEVAGTIARCGADVTDWNVGESVCALISGGGYASKATAHSDLLITIPDGWSFERAAGFPETFLTAYVNLFMEAQLKSNESVLIHGGGSGVGTSAIKLASRYGCQVFTTVGSPDKQAKCEELGAHTINYKTDDFVTEVKNETNGEGVDVILDMVGGSYLPRNIDALKPHGRLVMIAFLDGAKGELPIPTLMKKRLRVIGSVLRTRSLSERVQIRDRFLQQFGNDVSAGKLTPTLDRVFPIAEVEAAHTYLREFKNFGKVVLGWD